MPRGCNFNLCSLIGMYPLAGAAKALYSRGTVGWMEAGDDKDLPKDPEDSGGAVQSAVDYLLENSVPEEGTDAVVDLLRDLDIASVDYPRTL